MDHMDAGIKKKYPEKYLEYLNEQRDSGVGRYGMIPLFKMKFPELKVHQAKEIFYYWISATKEGINGKNNL